MIPTPRVSHNVTDASDLQLGVERVAEAMKSHGIAFLQVEHDEDEPWDKKKKKKPLAVES